MGEKNMNKKILLKSISLVAVLVILLSTMPLAHWFYQQSQKSMSLYVNPNFKINNYDSFYNDTEGELRIISMGADSLLRENGVKDVLHKKEILKSTLYVVIKSTKGFVFPPYVGRNFYPRFFINKTLSFEIYESKNLKPLLKLYTRRGIFNEGYSLDEILDKFKEGLIQAGWKEKKEVPTSEEKKLSGN